jgi:hypothetical protein
MAGTAQLVSPPLSFGRYQIRRTTGRQITEKVILLDGNWPPPGPAEAAVASALPSVPPITSAAPLPGTRATHEYQEEAASVASFDIAIGDGAELMVMARWFSTGAQASDPKQAPWRGVSVVDASREMVADLETQGRHRAGPDPVAACLIRLKPGAYELRYPIGSIGLFAQSLIVPPGGWRMEAYILHSETEISGRPAVSLLMRKAGEAWGGDQDVPFQKAMVALADERPIANEQLLSATPANPLARIVGAHLLLLSAHNQAGAEAAAVLAGAGTAGARPDAAPARTKGLFAARAGSGMHRQGQGPQDLRVRRQGFGGDHSGARQGRPVRDSCEGTARQSLRRRTLPQESAAEDELRAHDRPRSRRFGARTVIADHRPRCGTARPAAAQIAHSVENSSSRGQRANRIMAAPSRPWKAPQRSAETLLQRSAIDGLTRRARHLWTARSSLRIEVLQLPPLYRAPW